MTSLTSAVMWSQKLLQEKLQPGDFVIDGTAGNGHDSLFLAQRVMPGGCIWSFDIQEQAIYKTAERLQKSGYHSKTYTFEEKEMESLLNQGSAFSLDREGIFLFRTDHGQLGKLLERGTETLPPLKAAIFNLGYLPGGERTVTTQATSTIAALDGSAKGLAPEGRLIVVVYVGHDGAEEEAKAVDHWWAQLPPEQWDTLSITFPNRRGHPPYVLLAEKKKVKGRCE
ncbi:tRNA (mnm(5)s(2)U34)-methyltransferase [Heliorestis convoluta]|uniref:SAM-dependent methyltransferase n=1 Tax=Heliorestis convoluta TaxID=356322 RepID=A0A5Q2MWB4_9FIRM|nr:class I SAM-dependent methyltransferase [Heliorestis convoluta]QGG46537.1 SAM-dependent methyltransferase [Heliorestis convoluta]